VRFALKFSNTTRTLALLGCLAPSAAPAAGEEFSAIVHRSNPVENLSVKDLRAMFTGAISHWPNRVKIVLAQRESGSPPNGFLMARLLNTSWRDYKRSLETMEFEGQEPVTFRVLNSDLAACKFVFNVPSALALIATSSAASPECRDVRVLRIDGALPSQEGYKLK
jgi:hypothetical protein